MEQAAHKIKPGILIAAGLILICFAALLFIFWPKFVSPSSNLKINSPAYQNGSEIPDKYTCNGENISPSLEIGDVPEGTKSLSLIMSDPDAPARTWIHWVVWNIPPETTTIAENSIPTNASMGTNDFGQQNYGGPCPPSGIHRYVITVYALDTTFDMPKSTTAKQLEGSMAGHTLEKTELTGLCSKK